MKLVCQTPDPRNRRGSFVGWQGSMLPVVIIIATHLFCAKDPVWLGEFKSLIGRVNHDVESLESQMSPGASKSEVVAALDRLDGIIEYLSVDTPRIFKRYPEIKTEAGRFEKELGPDFQRLRRNAQMVTRSVQYWQSKLPKDKAFNERLTQIRLKLKKINMQTLRED